MNTQVLFAFKHPQAENPDACHVGMGVTALNAAMQLREARIPADAKPVQGGEYLWAKLSGEWAATTHIILCAPYIDAAFLGKLTAAFPQKRFALVYHSNLAFLCSDQFAAASLPQLLALEKAQPNFTVAANSAEMANAIQRATGRPFTHLPNLYHLPHSTRRQRSCWHPGIHLHIGIFGAARVLKNWLTAVTAAMIVQRTTGCPASLHLSSGRDEGAAATRSSLLSLLALNPDITLVDVPWMNADDFKRYLYGMDLLMQPSFTETFNNVTADGASCGVPSVVSEAIDWVPPDWMAKADSATAIADTGCRLLRDHTAGFRGWRALDWYNLTALEIWGRWLAQ